MAWKPGESGNPEGGRLMKPWRDAIRMEAAALEQGQRVDHPLGSLRWNAQRLLIAGEVPAIKELGDRLDGKPAQAIVGDDEHDPISVREIITGVPRAGED